MVRRRHSRVRVVRRKVRVHDEENLEGENGKEKSEDKGEGTW